jgi:pilus assembly protein FimV
MSSRTIGLVRPAISTASGIAVDGFPGDASREWFVASAIRPRAGVRTYMAFGFGFNKQKVLSAAEKYVQQGKLQNAIAEYDKILKNDTKDLTVSNTVGDLYARMGDNDKATDCFKSVGDAYATQGFTVKAIAMYKKISKLKPSLECVLKLAELYTQQGLFNDARAQYLQVAEEFLKSGELENAVRIFQKILEMDPENTAMRVRLAEVYVRLGKKTEAWQIFSAAAETMRSKGSLGGAQEVLQRMLTLDPTNSYALLMQGRNLLESGDAEAAITSLQKVGDIDSKPEGLRDLLKAYLHVGRLSDAGTLANKLLTVHNDLAAISSFVDALMQAGQYENALLVYDQHCERLLATNSAKVLESLHAIIGHVRENPASLEKLLALFLKAGDNTHVTEVYELLAHASVQSGDLSRARDLYQKLATVEPQNPLHMANYQQVVAQLGGTTAGAKHITPEEAAVIVDELEATAPPVHQHYSDEVALAVRSALTDAELFISYNIPAKALGPLLAVLPQAPNDVRLNQRLAALHTRAGRFAEAAICCHTLQNIYSDAGYPEEATRYGELAERYEQRSSTAMAAVAEEVSLTETASAGTAMAQAAAVPWPAFAPAPVHEAAHAPGSAETEFAIVAEPAEPSSGSAPAVEELDLFSEWEDSVTVEEATPAAERAAVEVSDAVGDHDLPAADASPDINDEKSEETVEEVRFYLGHGMSDQASAAFAKLQTLTRDQALLVTLRAEIEAASQALAGEEEFGVPVSIEEIAAEDIPSADLPAEEITVSLEDAPAIEVTPSALEPAPEVAASAPEVEPEVTVEQPGVLNELVADLESSLGDSFLPGAVEHDAEATAAEEHRIQPRAKAIEPHSEPAAPVEHHSHEAPALGEFVADLEASLGDDFLKGAPVAEPDPVSPVAPQAPPPVAPPKAAPPAVVPPVSPPMAAAAAAGTTPARARTVAPPTPPASHSMPVGAAKSSPFAEDAGVDLAEMFGELKQDLEADVASADEDPETHYNLGIAFREMGLLDEAIGELQKACQSVERGHAFPQIMQTYTWLAQCFLDKGVPEAAIRWYDKALSVPSIDGDTRVALHYELGAAYETLGDKPSALKHFTQVYGSNIDYRDVAERIKALKS